MKHIITTLLLLLSMAANAQSEMGELIIVQMDDTPNWHTLSKQSILPLSMEFMAGMFKGFGDEVEYHHYALSQRFPFLFRNGNRFWDGRYDDDGIFDGKHMLDGLELSCHLVSATFSFSDLKALPKGKRFKRIVFVLATNYVANKAGFFVGYNLINQNPVFK